jgi:acetyl esterase/lipase
VLRSAILSAAVVSAMSTAPGLLDAQQPSGLVRWEDVNRDPPAADLRVWYGADSLNFGDLRLPPGVPRPPLVVVIHGGCWRAENDLRHASHLSAALRDVGIATWTIEYRRVGNADGGWPGTFQDIVEAVNHVQALAPDHGLELDRITILGHSAGAQLALWLAAYAGNSEETFGIPKLEVSIASVVALAPITDLRAFSEGFDYCNRAVAPYLGGTPEVVPERFAFASPLELPIAPVPIYLVHGERDPHVPPSQSRTYRNAAAASGRTVTLEMIADAGHFDLVAPFSLAWPRVLAIIRSAVTSR